MQKAIISNNQVINIIEYTEEKGLAIHIPNGQFLYECTNFPVQIGDTLTDGVFYRDGVEITRSVTAEERIAQIEDVLLEILTEIGG